MNTLDELELKSPFLSGELFAEEPETGRFPRLAAFGAETPFLSAAPAISYATELDELGDEELESCPTYRLTDEASREDEAYMPATARRSPLRIPEGDGELDAFEMGEYEDEVAENVESEGFEHEGPEKAIEDALKREDWNGALQAAIAAGERDDSKLTNLLFFARHPDLDRNRKLEPKTSKADAKLAQEWAKIRDREVWATIEKSAKNTTLAVSGKEVAAPHRHFLRPGGKPFKQLVAWAAQEVDIDPGLLASALIAEVGGTSSYLTKAKVSSYHVGVDDFYAMRHILAKEVPAYAKIGWDRKQTPEAHLNDAQTNQREVKTIWFNSGRDGLLATAVYLKYAEVRLRSDAKGLGGDFDTLPIETRFALIRMSMAAGRAGAATRLKRALKGEDILVRNYKPAKAYQTNRNATIRAAQALHLSDWIFGNKPAPVAQPEMERTHAWDEEEYEFDRACEFTEADEEESAEFEEAMAEDEADFFDGVLDFEHLGIMDYQAPPPVVTLPTVGFEFDLNYGFESEITAAKVLSPPAGFSWPSEGLKVTDHEWKDHAGKLTDGFVVTLDAVRMEIATAPIQIDNDADFNTVVANVQQFGRELISATKTHEAGLDVAGVSGHPTTFHHPRTVVNKPEVDAHGVIKFPGDRDRATYARAQVPLVVHRVRKAYPRKTELWSSPQATLTLPLAEFGKLIWLIHRTKGGGPGDAFTGRGTDRLGLRDDLAWLALTRATADRKKKLGTPLSDGTRVTDADFTRSITSVLTIVLMYLLTSIKRDSRDQALEAFAKGSLPLNIKTPLWQIHKFALTDREKLILHELYTDTGKRRELFALASDQTVHHQGSTKLFPDYTRVDTERFFDTPTWHTLVDALVKEKPVLVTKENQIPKKKHRKGDEILIAPISSKIDWDKTKPRIAVEMRRLGFEPVHFAKWPGLMKRIRELAKKVNP